MTDINYSFKNMKWHDIEILLDLGFWDILICPGKLLEKCSEINFFFSVQNQKYHIAPRKLVNVVIKHDALNFDVNEVRCSH